MPHQATVTAQTGPARQLTGVVINDVTGIEFDLAGKRLFITVVQGAGDNVKEFDLASVTAVVFSIVTGNYSVTIS